METRSVCEYPRANGRRSIKHRRLGAYDQKPRCGMMHRMKRSFYRAAFAVGAVALMRFLHRNSLTILLYHGVAPQTDAGIANYRGKFITPAAFDHQIAYFKKHYKILDLDDAISSLRVGTLPPNALAITFDDGYRNFYTHAYPILKKHRVRATMFLTSDFVLDKQPLWVDRLEYAMGHGTSTRAEKMRRDDTLRSELKKLPARERDVRIKKIEQEAGVMFSDFAADREIYAPLSLEEIRDLRSAGMTFAAHTLTHPILARESEEDGAREIKDSVARLTEAIGPLSRTFAYPNGQEGDWRGAHERAAQEAECTAALTTIEGVNTPKTHPYRLHRFTLDATDHTPAFAAIASGVRIYIRTIKQLLYAQRG